MHTIAGGSQFQSSTGYISAESFVANGNNKIVVFVLANECVCVCMCLCENGIFSRPFIVLGVANASFFYYCTFLD